MQRKSIPLYFEPQNDSCDKNYHGLALLNCRCRRPFAPTLLDGILSTLCLKNVLPLTCYNLDIHSWLTIIFDTNVTEKVDNQSGFYFPTSLNYCFCTTWRNRKSGNCVFSLKCYMLFYQKHTKHIKTLPGLWSPYVIGRPYIFSCCGLFFFLSFFLFFFLA